MCDKDCPVKKYCRKHVEDDRLAKFGYYKPEKHCHYEACIRCERLVEITVMSDYHYPGSLCKSMIDGRESRVANAWNRLYRCWRYRPLIEPRDDYQLSIF